MIVHLSILVILKLTRPSERSFPTILVYYFDVVEVELAAREIGQQKGFSNYLENVQRPTSLQSFGTS